MRKFGLFLMAVIAVMIAATSVFAQPLSPEAAAASASGVKAIAAGVGFAIAVVGGALGQSRIGAAACEGATGQQLPILAALLGLAGHHRSGGYHAAARTYSWKGIR